MKPRGEELASPIARVEAAGPDSARLPAFLAETPTEVSGVAHDALFQDPAGNRTGLITWTQQTR